MNINYLRYSLEAMDSHDMFFNNLQHRISYHLSSIVCLSCRSSSRANEQDSAYLINDSLIVAHFVVFV